MTSFLPARKRIVFLLVAVVLTACTPMMYGVPLEQWDKLSEAQKLETIKGYNERQLLRQQEYLRAQEARAAAAEKTASSSGPPTLVVEKGQPSFYRGESARYGDLLRIVIKNGTLRFDGKQRGYDPVSFTIASGETLHIPVSSGANRQTALIVSYHDGILIVDPKAEHGLKDATRLVYEPDWKAGKTYPPLNSRGPARLAGASLYIEIVPVYTKERR